MAHLVQQFDEALNNVEPIQQDKTNAAEAHTEVRKSIENDDQLAGMGVDTILIGSYARSVSIRRMHDVDVFSKLPDVDFGLEPAPLLDQFHRVLSQRFGQSRVKRRTRIVEVDFPEFDMSVDAVPARPAGIVWEIPDRSAGWVETNPEELGRLTHEMNGHHTLGTEGIYVPIVKLVRQIRREHFAKHPAGVYFEVLAYWAFQDMAACSSQAEYLSRALAGMTVTLRNALTSGMKDPSLPDSNLETKADAAQLAQTLSTLTSLSQHADMALAEEDECKSALEWRDLLGRNDDGLVFPMPAHCDEEGRRKFDFDVVAGSKRVPSGEGKFACLS